MGLKQKNRKSQSFGEFIKKEDHINILKSILPGGENWKAYRDYEDAEKRWPCLGGCYNLDRCKNRPEKVCSDDWEDAEVDIENLEIAQHALNNFDHYDRGDLEDYSKNSKEVFDLIALISIKLNRMYNATETETATLKKARAFQSQFKIRAIQYWERCSITSSAKLDIRFLEAAHIKPYIMCSRKEKRDVHNSLLLTPDYHKLFDMGLIGFNDNGAILINSKLTSTECKYFKIHDKLKLNIRKLDAEVKYYLAEHRKLSKLSTK